MPYGGIERPSEYERAADQAERNARELAKEQQRQFVCAYEAGRLAVTPFPNLELIHETFERARVAQEPPVLSDTQRSACAELVKEARAAIHQADVEKMRFALGPDFYNHRRAYTETTRANYWEYLSCLIKLAITQRREAVLLQFASEHAYPEELNPEQQGALKAALFAAFDQGDEEKKFNIPASWNIGEELLAMVQHEAIDFFKNEHEKIRNEKCITHLLETLRAVTEQGAELQKEIHTSKAKQDALLGKVYALPLADDGEETWKQFRKSCAAFSGVEKRIQVLQDSGFVWVSFAECEGDESLLDLAVIRYAESRFQTQKASLLRCIEILVAHGSRLTSETALKRLDWSALSKILPYVSSPTRRVAVAQVALLEYTKESEQQVRSFWWRMFHSSDIKAQRCQSVRNVLWQFFADPELPLAQQERKIMEAVQTAEAAAKPKIGGSGLFNALINARRADETSPLLPPGDNELRSIKATPGGYGSTD